jgi:hypothetical protein
MTATLSAKTPLPLSRASGGSDGDLKTRLRDRITVLERQARLAAEAGEIAVAARTILETLDCERRLAAIGPQVLQVIKPRA